MKSKDREGMGNSIITLRPFYCRNGDVPMFGRLYYGGIRVEIHSITRENIAEIVRGNKAQFSTGTDEICQEDYG